MLRWAGAQLAQASRRAKEDVNMVVEILFPGPSKVRGRLRWGEDAQQAAHVDAAPV